MKIMLSLLLLASTLFSAAASACSCAPATLEQFYERAAAVFIAQVTDVQQRSRERGGYVRHTIEATYEVKESFKGEPQTSGSFTDGLAVGGSCTIGVKPATDYIVFLNTLGAVTVCTGSRPYDPARHAELVDQLRALRTKGTAAP